MWVVIIGYGMLVVNVGGVCLCGWTIRRQRRTNGLQAETAAMLAKRETAVLLREGRMTLVEAMAAYRSTPSR